MKNNIEKKMESFLKNSPVGKFMAEFLPYAFVLVLGAMLAVRFASH